MHIVVMGGIIENTHTIRTSREITGRKVWALITEYLSKHDLDYIHYGYQNVLCNDVAYPGSGTFIVSPESIRDRTETTRKVRALVDVGFTKTFKEAWGKSLPELDRFSYLGVATTIEILGNKMLVKIDTPSTEGSSGYRFLILELSDSDRVNVYGSEEVDALYCHPLTWLHDFERYRALSEYIRSERSPVIKKYLRYKMSVVGLTKELFLVQLHQNGLECNSLLSIVFTVMADETDLRLRRWERKLV